MLETDYETTSKSTKRAVDVKLMPGDEILHDNNFTFDGYQVVRGEFFAHIREPSITFNKSKVSLNAACLNRLPIVDYVQILVNAGDLKLVVRPCNEGEKDSFAWCSQGAKRRPKYVTCRVFFAKIMDLMNWNPDYRYKLLGKLIQSRDEFLFVFDLTSTEVYQSTISSDGKNKASRNPTFPAEWQNQFGLSVEEHRKRLQVDIFKGYTVFSVKDNGLTDSQNTLHEPLPKEVHNEP